MLQSFGEIAITINEAAQGSDFIAKKAVSISESAADVLERTEDTKNGTQKLNIAVEKFTV